jgi:hypothetical protein
MRVISLLPIVTAILLAPTLSSAQASRTWVSGVGDDANPCSRTAPCKTFAGAISKTAAGGEIDALDPAGFGALTIIKAITIDGGGGQVASVLVSGTNGIVVAAGAADVVTIRNIYINGIGSGINGIRFLSGKALHIEHVNIFGFTANGIDIAKSDGGQVLVSDTVATNNGGSGIRNTSSITSVDVVINRSRFDGNTFAGAYASDFSRFSVRESSASGNTYGFLTQGSAGPAAMNISNSIANNNSSTGVWAGGLGGASVARIGGVSMFGNGVQGLKADVNGSIVSFGSNYNSGAGSPSSSIVPQ